MLLSFKHSTTTPLIHFVSFWNFVYQSLQGGSRTGAKSTTSHPPGSCKWQRVGSPLLRSSDGLKMVDGICCWVWESLQAILGEQNSCRRKPSKTKWHIRIIREQACDRFSLHQNGHSHHSRAEIRASEDGRCFEGRVRQKEGILNLDFRWFQYNQVQIVSFLTIGYYWCTGGVQGSMGHPSALIGLTTFNYRSITQVNTPRNSETACKIPMWWLHAIQNQVHIRFSSAFDNFW